MVETTGHTPSCQIRLRSSSRHSHHVILISKIANILQANGGQDGSPNRGKVILISGGARGQGAAEARLFVAEGARVVIGDVLEPEVRLPPRSGPQTSAKIRCSDGVGGRNRSSYSLMVMITSRKLEKVEPSVFPECCPETTPPRRPC